MEIKWNFWTYIINLGEQIRQGGAGLLLVNGGNHKLTYPLDETI